MPKTNANTCKVLAFTNTWAVKNGQRKQQTLILLTLLKKLLMELSADTVNRSSLILVEKDGLSLEQAMEQLRTFRIQLECGDAIRQSIPLQAALLTAVNAGNRAFLGGVYINMPENVQCLLPWESGYTLNQIVAQLGGEAISTLSADLLTLTFGVPGDTRRSKVEVVATDWQGGIFVNGESLPQAPIYNLPLGGIYAGGLAVALAFLKTSKIHPMAVDKSVGLSLWRPDLIWLTDGAEGPANATLPSGLWILGLGHLGQAYLWAIGLLPYTTPSAVEIMLQDYDKVVDANLSAGLLCTKDDSGRYKSRVCTDWLEKRGIRPRITDRVFDVRTKCGEKEPNVALCGFDNALARTFLEKANFEFIVEAGLGNSVDDFDKVIIHIFPSYYHTAENEWRNEPEAPQVKARVLNAIKDEKKECGILEYTIAGKSASASFVLAELIKGLNGGLRTDLFVNQLRFPSDIRIVSDKINYETELGTTTYQKTG
jgi:hypothetical protein